MPRQAVAYMAEQLRLDPALFSDYAWSGRTIEYHRAQIRAALGFRRPVTSGGAQRCSEVRQGESVGVARSWLAVVVVVMLGLTALGITVRVLVVDPWVHASRLLAQLDQLTTSFHVDSSDDESVYGELRADGQLRPYVAYRILSRDGGAVQISVRHDGQALYPDHRYERAAEDARWLTDAELDPRIADLEPWERVPAARVTGVEQLAGGPAWHVHSDLPPVCCNATDVWIDMHGLPVRAAAFSSDHLAHFAYSSVNAVPLITSPPAPVPADQGVGDEIGSSRQNEPVPRRPLTVGTGVLVVRSFGPAFSPKPASPPRDGYGYIAIDLEMDNPGMAPLGYQVSLHGSLGTAPVVSGRAASIPSAGELAARHATVGRLVFQVPNQEWPRFLLAAHIGGADVYVRLFWMAPAR